MPPSSGLLNQIQVPSHFEFSSIDSVHDIYPISFPQLKLVTILTIYYQYISPSHSGFKSQTSIQKNIPSHACKDILRSASEVRSMTTSQPSAVNVGQLSPCTVCVFIWFPRHSPAMHFVLKRSKGRRTVIALVSALKLPCYLVGIAIISAFTCT